jgi:heme oxygenase
VLSEEIGPFRSGIWNALVEFTYRIYLDDLSEGRMIQKLADTGDLRGAATSCRQPRILKTEI